VRIAAIRKQSGKLLVLTDVCLRIHRSWTLRRSKDGDVLNEATLPILAEQALAHADAERMSRLRT